MDETRLIEISDIIEQFDVEELTANVHEQLFGETSYTGAVALLIDYLSPIYYKFESIMNDDSMDDDVRIAARSKFYEICENVVSEICEKFNLNFDSDYLRDQESNLPAITLSMYFVFVLHFMEVLYEVMSNYIAKNREAIAETFADVASKKDMVTLVNKKHLSEVDATIVANINNVAQWIFQNMSEEAFLDYMDPGYSAGNIFRQMIEEGAITGEFMIGISNEFHNNLGLKSKICFNYYCAKAEHGTILDESEDL